MKNVSELDTNFKINTAIDKGDIKFYNIDTPPFKLYGVFRENGKYRRMPESVAKAVSSGVFALHTNTAGGRVRFKTDSPYIAIYAKMSGIGKMPHFALTGSAGFDMYSENGGYRHIKTFAPPFDIKDGYESLADFGFSHLREITVNFPLYSGVDELYIGVSEAARIYEPEPYKLQKPMVFYGSSITQGGCASRPGSCYEGIISRRFHSDYINLGFSGNALAEEEMAHYIKGLDMSAFIYDYDHNAPDNEHLLKTHERMFRIIREANPELPVIIMSRPKYHLAKGELQRLAIIKATYDNAKKSGDKNVYLLDGRALMAQTEDEGTVDTLHPTDLGFASMAKALGDVLEELNI
ncbi:MAG: hypothetical protein IJZ75_06020 [Clostridia bacterium]|nr:hypothetical protein [Clostridia bacterium]